MGGAVANTTSAYAELAAVSAELAVLEQQQKAQAALDAKIAQAKALPTTIKDKVVTTTTETIAAAKAAPKNAMDTITSTVNQKLSSVQSSAQSQLEAARREIEARKPK